MRKLRDSDDAFEFRPLVSAREAEINPALRHHLRDIYAVELPETVDLTSFPFCDSKNSVTGPHRPDRPLSPAIPKSPQNRGCESIQGFPSGIGGIPRQVRAGWTWPRRSANPRNRQDQRSFSTLRRTTAAGRSANRGTRISTSAVRRKLRIVRTVNCIGAWHSSRRGRAINPPQQFPPPPPRLRSAWRLNLPMFKRPYVGPR
jgi:hypothetical protein